MRPAPVAAAAGGAEGGAGDGAQRKRPRLSGPGLVRLNVGGFRFETTRDTLCRTSCYFARLLSEEWPVTTDEDGNIFIDRDGSVFDIVLNYLRHGQLQPATRQALEKARLEAQFYALDGLTSLLDEALNPAPVPTRTFDYHFDGDCNGLLYWIGSAGRTRKWLNPFTDGRVNVFPSGLPGAFARESDGEEGHKLVERSIVTDSGVCFMGVSWTLDLFDVRLRPSAYTLRACSSCEGVSDWTLWGSVDAHNWELLHDARNVATFSLQNPGCACHGHEFGEDAGLDFEMEQTLVRTIQLNTASNAFYRYIKVSDALAGRCDFDQYRTECAHVYGIELYGDAWFTSDPAWPFGREVDLPAGGQPTPSLDEVEGGRHTPLPPLHQGPGLHPIV